jgi:hypothetical protein
MGNDGIGAPLSRRVPGEARPGPGQPVRPVLPESVLNRMQAAIDAEHAHEEVHRPGEPNTEPLPKVTGSGSPNKHAAASAPSPSGMLPETEMQQDRAAKPGAAKPLRTAKPPRAEEPLRVAKALRAAEELRAAAAARVHAAEPEPPSAAEPEALRVAEPLRTAQPEPLRIAEPEPLRAAEVQPPPAAEPPRVPMPTATAAYGSQPTPGTIGWLWPDETDARGGGGGRRRPPRRFSGGGGWRYRTATLVALGAVLLAAVGLVIGMSLRSGAATPSAHGTSRPKATAPAGGATHATTPTPSDSAPPDPGIVPDLAAAATWVTAQVGAGTAVACDAQTCPVLTASGFPAANEVQIQVNPQLLSSARIVVVTPAVRNFFSNHPALGTDIAPEVLASFGPITVQPVDSAGGSAYQAEFSQDVQARIQVGKQLLNSGDVTGTPVAEAQLAAGDVDSRILLAIQALAQQQAVYIVAFGDSGPGVSAGIPFRAVELGETDPTGAIAPQTYVQSMIGVLNAHATFPAFAHAGSATLADGQTVGHVQWALPLPLGLLTP